jgi:hypothetical protein
MARSMMLVVAMMTLSMISIVNGDICYKPLGGVCTSSPRCAALLHPLLFSSFLLLFLFPFPLALIECVVTIANHRCMLLIVV